MKLGYTIIYVADVPKTVAFYETAFGLSLRFMHDSTLYAEMETGETALAFAADIEVESNGVNFTRNVAGGVSAGWEICFVDSDVARAFDRAVAAGATGVLAPVVKPWGQTVSYVRDLNGCLVELASPIAAT